MQHYSCIFSLAVVSSFSIRLLPASFARVLFGQMHAMSARCDGHAHAQIVESGKAEDDAAAPTPPAVLPAPGAAWTW